MTPETNLRPSMIPSCPVFEAFVFFTTYFFLGLRRGLNTSHQMRRGRVIAPKIATTMSNSNTSKINPCLLTTFSFRAFDTSCAESDISGFQCATRF